MAQNSWNTNSYAEKFLHWELNSGTLKEFVTVKFEQQLLQIRILNLNSHCLKKNNFWISSWDLTFGLKF